MTDRPTGLWRNEQHQYFYGDRGPFPSVSTIVKVLDKSGPLVGWAKRETAASAIRNLDHLKIMLDSGGAAAAQAWLSGIPDYQRDEAADIGHRVHQLADAIQRGEAVEVTDLEMRYLNGLMRFLYRIRPIVTHSETTVINLTRGYGGTFDMGCLIDGIPTLLDLKTGKRVYDETALQLAGYAQGEFTAAINDPTPIPLPHWQRFGVVHIQPDDWTLIPYDVTPDTIAAFNAAHDLYRWNRDLGPWSQGAPVKEVAP